MEKVFKGHRSPFRVPVLDVFGQPYTAEAMAGITRVYLKYIADADTDPKYVDSATDPAAFDCITHADAFVIIVDVGMLDLPIGHDLAAEIVVYDATYPQGRVITQVDMQVVDDALGDVVLADSLLILLGGPSVMNLVDPEDPIVLTREDLLKTICAVSASDILVQLPSMGESEDGLYLDFVVGGAGSLIATCADEDTIGDALKTIMTLSCGADGTFGQVRIQYFHALTAWVVFRMGRISGS